MELNVSRKIVKEFINVRDENILIDNIYNDFFENFSRNITFIDYKKAGSYYSLFLNKLEIDKDDKDFKTLAYKTRLNIFDELDKNKYLNNPYYKNIKLEKDIKYKNLLLTKSTYKPFQAFIYKDIDVLASENYREINHLGYFKQEFSFIDLVEKDTTWMSITPHEIETMEESLKEVNGNVLVLGLGLGYYPYIASLKDNVKTIDIVEVNKDIISIFCENILPQFSQKKKVNIINKDALKFLIENDLNKYDYIFIDLWHTVEDGLELYVKISKILNDVKIKTNYWIETSLIASIRRALITLLEENLEGFKDKDYQNASNFFFSLINELYFKLKNSKINSKENLIKFLSNENIKKLISK